MAASDQTYRNQKTLHVVFAVSSVAMLLSTVWMFAEDFNRPFKRMQRNFRDVEEEISKRAMLASAPDEARRKAVIASEQEVTNAKARLQAVKDRIDADTSRLRPARFQAEKRLQDLKADFDSTTSLYNIAVEQHGPEGSDSVRLKATLESMRENYDRQKGEVEGRTEEIEQLVNKPYEVQVKGDDAPVTLTKAEAERQLNAAEDRHKALTADFDRFLKVAEQKQWTFGDWVRSLPVLDAFQSPTKIQQFTLDELPIDYGGFKYVTRYDRCTTCHLGMDKASYDKATLTRLTGDPAKDQELMADLGNAEAVLNERNEVVKTSGLSSKEKKQALLDASVLKPRQVPLSEAQVNAYAVHPQLDLFVGSNSPHPAEKFGCTICHGGQGSATTFVDATHTPNNAPTAERWMKPEKRGGHEWESIHFWDFPMLPKRFTESGCVKCHHQITDLVRDGVRSEAPKLLQGYNLVRELGCFGCHEIAGTKNGRWVGPDLRLEPETPLEDLSPGERQKLTADPANPPGAMRKVGPSLARIAEKTHEDWVAKWLKAPRDFRPDTRMPHFYLQANNAPEALQGTGQERFPDTEIHAITFYLFEKSRGLLNEVKAHHDDKAEAAKADAELVQKLSAKGTPTPEDKQQLAEVKARISARSMPLPVESLTLPAAPADDKAKAQQLERGRNLFATRGCLACHQHGAMAEEGKPVDEKLKLPPLVGESNFGPNLSRVAAKIGTKPGDPQSGRKWLVQWLLNPKVHSPRTLMPSVQLAPDQADDIAAWLLSQSVTDWKGLDVPEPKTEDLQALAKVYLQKILTKRELNEVLKSGFTKEQLEARGADADENELAAPLTDAKLKTYLGKKAIANLGCYGCHTIPGFQGVKPIGVALNNWGVKDPDRIAFEDSEAYVRDHYKVAELRDDPNDGSKPAEDWKAEPGERQPIEKFAPYPTDGKPPFEKYFSEALDHHRREGFLHLKLMSPRSYDYERIRNWDERARMPQFKFARTHKLPDESDEAYRARASKEEAESREAVMTFILGLIAEPIPSKYVANPAPDRAAEVKGRQVLDKFNCAGCHIVRQGYYDLKLTNDKFGNSTLKQAVVDKLEGVYQDFIKDDSNYGADNRFPEDNAWGGLPQPRPDRLTLRGMYPEVQEDEGKKYVILRLTEALRFHTMQGEPHELPAATNVIVPADAVAAQAAPYGGTFAELLSKYLQARDPEAYGANKVNYSYAAGPPSLHHEGEKVQPSWLFQFLLNPKPIRPMTVLRMPKFSLSDEDAMAVVNYFSAVEKMTNPGIGLTTPYLSVPQRDPGYLEQKTAEYVARLKEAKAYDGRLKDLEPVWKQILRDQTADAEDRQKAAEARLIAAKGTNAEEMKSAELAKATADEAVKALKDRYNKSDFKELKDQWEQREAYVADAYRLVANGNLCLNCHAVGSVPAKEQQGPLLSLSAERLRPEWTQRWMGNPQRFLHYTTIMPLNFKANAPDYQDVFAGSSAEQIQAVRDFLMLYPQVVDWALLKHRPGPGTQGAK